MHIVPSTDDENYYLPFLERKPNVNYFCNNALYSTGFNTQWVIPADLWHSVEWWWWGDGDG